ncbi:hypothetical protein C7445_11369 [Alicyclobacillus sacchari]|uniref:Uncharacterized protein n=1 Tax=Alicyclobacillus sacchari TaxID=392010 RepID=A0A4R8LIZ7_9BACL|nr:hypothetical protein [Alicyclobacillus sacchari]TDY42835.1 hypothetical protein C7445_11369 [Alicyclobacillus sacchari]GMA57006.1 hypothetical protein GCM10025858_15090 [Alicyclobacillus sacchari]
MARRRRAKPWLRWLILIALFWTAIRLMGPLAADVVERPHSAQRTLLSEDAVSALQLSATGWTWNGRPVYRVENLSNHVLSHVTITSWQGDLLPILAISGDSPRTVPKYPLTNPPYKLPPGYSAWFVGEDEGRPRYVVSWLAIGGKEAYEVVSARLVSPA